VSKEGCGISNVDGCISVSDFLSRGLSLC